MPKRKKAGPLLSHGSEGLDAEVGHGEMTSEFSGLDDVVEDGRSTDEENQDVEDGEGGEDGGDGRVGGGGGGKKTRIAGLYCPPTHDELRTLKETQNLYQSNLMRLQITELLTEVKPSSSCGRLEEILTALRTTLVSLPSTSPIDLCEAVQALPPKIHYPLNLDPSSVKGKFVFRPPLAVRVVGSYLLKTAVKPDINVDLALQIPPECLQAKDHLNYRYLHKRALYLCHVAAALRRKKTCSLEKIRFSVSHGGPLLPVLHLTLNGKAESRYTIRLHTTVPESPWKPVKLVPNRNNLRPHLSLSQLPPHLVSLVVATGDSEDGGCEVKCSEEDSEGASLPPTPHYNSLILGEMGGMERHLSDVYAAQQECPAMANAVVLFRVWARQRGLNQGYGGYTGFHFSLLLALLLTLRKISPLMSSYQILKIALQTIASSDWSTSGVSMAAQDPSLPSLFSFHSHYPVVFLDSSGLLNLLAHLSLSRYLWLRHEAAVSLDSLDNPVANGFTALFMTPVIFELKFDILLHISPVSALHSLLAKDSNEGKSLLLDGGSWPLPLIMARLLPLLIKGLGKRVKLLTFRPFESAQWLVSKEPVCPCDSHVTVGVDLDPDHAFSLLEMGPPADSKQAGEFRVFWGEKSELRRFQDGSINEAVVWEGGSVGERRGVVTQIVTHLLHRHVGVPLESVTSSAGSLSSLLSLPLYSANRKRDHSSSQLSLTPLATGEEEGKKIEDVFVELSKQLRGLKGLPLAITSVQGASPEFRHCSVFPPLAWNGRTPRKVLAAPPGPENQSDCLYPSCDSATAPFVPALEVVVQLEGSGKWPSELPAISSVKTAFYSYLSGSLADQCQLLCSPTHQHLDVLKNGYVFRLRIHYLRELSILRESISSAKSHEVSGLKKTLVTMQRECVDKPLLTSILHGLSLQYSSFGAGARLCKRWIAAHMMTNHMRDEAVEVMVAHLFLQPQPFTQPNSPEAVLLRFLSLLSTHDWETEPLILNLNNELSVSEMADIRSSFTSQRSQLPPCFIATPLHRDSSPLTSPSPSFPVFHRLCQLAKESLGVLTCQFSSPDLPTLDIKQVFRTPLTGYNVLIHLHKKHVPLAPLAVDVAMETGSTHTKHSSSKEPTHFPVTDFNPVEIYITELERAFSEFCLFFYDKYGGRCIAVVWKPQAFAPQPFKVMQAFCKTKAEPRSKKKKLESLYVPDVEAIIADFELMGQGLVSSVEIVSEPPTLCSS